MLFHQMMKRPYGSVPVFRFLNKDLGSHFYTAFGAELVHVLELAEFQYEGIGFRAYDQKTSATKPYIDFSIPLMADIFLLLMRTRSQQLKAWKIFGTRAKLFLHMFMQIFRAV